MAVVISEELARLARLRDQGILTPEEFEAQKAQLLRPGGANLPPGTPAPKKRSPLQAGCLGLAAVLFVLFVIGMIAGGKETKSSDDNVADAATAVAPTDVTAVELFNAYQANEAAAQQRYGNRPLRVTGTVAGVDLDLSDNPVVKLATPNQFMSASANLADASKAKASALVKGQKVVVLCSGVTEVISIPQLADCEIQ